MGKLEDCNGFLKEHTDSFFIDRYRLGYHLSSPCGWMNDPHNPILFQDQYHVFFNLFPYEAEGFRPKFWGHAVSEDMIDFTFLPCALAPDSDLDKNGCASGCAVVKDGRVYLIYTGKNEEREPRELQVIAVSEDGIKFIKPDCNPILKVDGVTGQNCRDPRIWEQSGKYYMLLGNTDEGNGRALLFSSKDLFKWDEEGVFCNGNGSQGYMWECPDYVRINSNEFLILSAEGMSNMRHSTVYLTGTTDGGGRRFRQNRCYVLDNGIDFYAPQTYESRNGKKMLIAWMDDWFSEMPSRKNGWAGSLTIPRRLGVNEAGMLEMFPAEELKKLRKTGFRKSSFIAEKNADVLSGQKAEKFELRFDIDLSKTNADIIELRVRESFDGKQYTSVIFNLKSNTVIFDKTRSGEGSGSVNDIKLKYFNGDRLDTVVYADTTSVEILINRGTTSITNRIYPDPGSTSIHLLSPNGSIGFCSLEFYTLGNNTISFMYA